jgi:hypothetical protein
VIARRRLLAGAALAPVVGAALAQTETSAPR